MKLALFLVGLTVALPLSQCWYLRPSAHPQDFVPITSSASSTSLELVNDKNAHVVHLLSNFLGSLDQLHQQFQEQQKHISPSKRCANLFDEACITNGGNVGADDGWLTGGNNPGKRCANLFDEGCANGGLGSAGVDDGWLSGGNTPGRK